MGENLSDLHCSFCGKVAHEVKKLIAGDNVYICDECVDKCYTILNESKTEKKIEKTEKKTKIPSPKNIKEFLDDYIIGQDYAKEILSVAVYNHYKRLENPIIDGIEIEKSNILMLGPTGSGKTLLAQTIAKFLKVPFAIADATSLTETGYVGLDIESIVSNLLYVANNDVSLAEKGIIFLDEIDKKRIGTSMSNTRDPSGEGVQQALLKMLEGTEVMVPIGGVKKTPNTELIKVNTKNILFIVGGAFMGIEKIIEKKINSDNISIGFGGKLKELNKKPIFDILRKIEPDNLVEFGMIPELVGRLPIIAPLSDLNEMQLVNIMTQPKNSIIKQFSALFRLDGIQLEFTENALLYIAKLAKKRKTNGRALRSILENILMKTQFQLPELKEKGVIKIIFNEINLDKDIIPDIIYKH